ncbi:MAG: hypothetical protein EZS28_015674 [Streblomastix strix]|uniref:Uncharacterized protein n=1 Tax=Streblomastix strix TaxID=222440 RepID=A0A5J4W1N3_9EUKA|nr:MAG: hypothetical protein EZS28_015674 [Streblomastix strix]
MLHLHQKTHQKKMKKKKQIKFEKKDDIRVEICDGYCLRYGYGYDYEKGVGYKHISVPQTRSTNPFGTQGNGEPSQIFTTHRQNGNNIQEAELDELPAIMQTTLKLQ